VKAVHAGGKKQDWRAVDIVSNEQKERGRNRNVVDKIKDVTPLRPCAVCKVESKLLLSWLQVTIKGIEDFRNDRT
jgi:predicted nucleic acid-binding Zn ribbon protein